MLRCREVVDLLASDHWRATPLHRRVSLAVHLAMCRYCRSYARSLRAIARAARQLYESKAEDTEKSDRVLDAVRRAATRTDSD